MAIVKTLPAALRGVTVQVFRDKVPGKTPAARRASMTTELRRWKALGCVGFAPHGFTMEMPAQVPELVGLARDAGLQCLPVFGVDSDDAAGKSERILAVARVPGVAGVGIDAEGKYEDEGASAEAQHATDLGAALIAADEPLVVIHQPWPVPGMHESRYPWVQFARYCTAWGNQDYYNDWASTYGASRFNILDPRFRAYWAAFNARVLAPQGLGAIERISTVQGSGWSDIPYDCVTCVVKRETLVVWCEPYPEAAMLEALRVRHALDVAVGLYVLDAAASGGRRWSGEDALQRFQVAYNGRVGPSKQLRVDNAYGPATERALRGGWMAKTAAAIGRAFGLAA